MKRLFILMVLALVPMVATAAGTAANDLMIGYQDQGATEFSAQRGKAMWNESHVTDGGCKVSCASCHGSDLTKAGEHMKTGKLIEPMAPSVYAKRLTDTARIEKWFLRNCKGTFGRECSAQEKGDFLTYIQSN